MPYQLNSSISELTPYSPIEGDYRVRLDANESFLELPPRLYKEALEAGMKTPLNRYPDWRALELCKAFGDFYGVPYEQVMAGNGSDELLALIIGTFFLKEEELITLSNDFSMYRLYGEEYGTKISIYPKKPDLKLDVDGLIYYAKLSGARGIIFSNPCNPTSLCLDKSEVIRLATSLDCLVIVDEAYMDFASESVLHEVSRLDNLIVLKTCSKAIGLASIRLGFAVSNKKLTDALLSVKSPYNVNEITQKIGTSVLKHTEYINGCIEKIIFSRDYLYNGIMKLYVKFSSIERVYETATNFVFIKSSKPATIYAALLERSIAVRKMDRYLRICAGTREENDLFLDALYDILVMLE